MTDDGQAPVIFSPFWEQYPYRFNWEKLRRFFPQLGKIAPLDLYENTGWKCQAPIPRTIKIIVSNLNWK